MEKSTAKRLLELLNECSRLLNDAAPQLIRASSEDSVALYRLHTAAILSAALSHIAIPIWHDQPDLQEPPGSAKLGTFRMSSEASEVALRALTEVQRAMQEARTLVQATTTNDEERQRYDDGIRKVLAYVEEALDVISRHRTGAADPAPA